MPPKLVLIVEDDDDLRQSLGELLELEGYRTRLARNGQEAIDYLEHEDAELPALILLDLMMPVLDGWGFRARQRHGRAAAVPVAAFTAMGPQRPPIEVAAVLPKPIGHEELFATIRRLCGAA